jgi:hypothetical protein
MRVQSRETDTGQTVYEVIADDGTVRASFRTNDAAWLWLDRNDPREAGIEDRQRRIRTACGQW